MHFNEFRHVIDERLRSFPVSEPRYITIANDYARLIRSGELPPGTPLPSYAELAKQHGVSMIVIREVVRRLQSEHLVRTVRRRGTYVTKLDERTSEDTNAEPSLPPGADDLDRLRNTDDPVQRARSAGELITAYQVRIAELGAIRQEAIEEAHERGLSFAEISQQLGLTPGRISQIRRPRH